MIEVLLLNLKTRQQFVRRFEEFKEARTFILKVRHGHALKVVAVYGCSFETVYELMR